MAGISAYAQKQMLDWVLGGASATQPASRLAAVTFGIPTSVSAMGELTDLGYTRASVLFGAAASPAGSASNTASFTFGPFSSSATILGALIYDATAGGNILWYGPLPVAQTVQVGDRLAFAAGGGLIVTLS